MNVDVCLQRMVLLVSLLLTHGCLAAPPTYYEGKSEGWFWYEDPVTPEPEPAPKKDTEPPASQSTQQAAPVPLSTEWIRENLPKALDAAIDNPTSENIQTYLYLQRYSLDKSEKFARQVALVTQTDPVLDENTRNPVSTHAKRLANKLAARKTNELIAEVARRGSLWFFYTSQCPYCLQIAPTLKSLSHQYGLQTLPISLDGRPLPGGYFEEYRRDQGHAEKLNVTVTPTIYLAYPPDTFVPITHGVISLSEMKDRIVNAAYSANIITEEAYDTANGILVTQPIPDLQDITIDEQGFSASSKKLLEEIKSIYGNNK